MTYLEKCEELKSLISLQKGFQSSKLCTELKKNAKIQIIVENNEPYFDKYYLYVENAKIAHVMDAMMSLRDSRWWRYIKGSRKSLDMFIFEETDDAVRNNEFSRKNDNRYADRYLFIRNMLDEFYKNPNLANKISRGITGKEMTATLKKSFLGMIQDEMDKNPPPPGLSFDPITPDRLDNAKLIFTVKRAKLQNTYNVGFAIPDIINGSYTYTDFDSGFAKERASKFGEVDGVSSIHRNSDGKLSMIDRKKHRKILNQRCQIRVSKGTLIDAVSDIFEQVDDVSFFCDHKDQFQQRLTFAFPEVTVEQALNRLTQMYAKTDWELRKSGVILIRSPQNPLSK
jgi:hypothetical protein